MKENREELKRNLTSANIFKNKLELEEDQIHRQNTIPAPIEEQQHRKLYKPLKASMKFNFDESVLMGYMESILAEKEGKHSPEWKALMDAVTEAQKIISNKKHLNSDEGVLKLLALSEACNHYYETHFKSKGKIESRRKRNARSIRNILSDSFGKSAGLKEDKELLSVARLDQREEGASANVKRLAEYYVSFSKKVGEDIVGSSEEKLRRRWNVLKSCEEDILIYSQTHEADQKSEPEIWHVIKEYNSIRKQIRFLDKLKKEGGHDAVFENKIADDLLRKIYETEGKALPKAADASNDNGDEGLNDKQLAGLSEIDTWVVRNFNNGGYMAGLETTDRGDIVNNLLSLSRRERMFIYYLVEKRERINPSMEGFGMSQTNYVPDVKAFKKQMIANKLKFYSRFSGGYIYWNKLSQAMAIATRTRPMVETVIKNKTTAAKKGKTTRKVNRLNENQKQQKKHLKNLYKLLKEGKIVLENISKEKSESKKADYKQDLIVLRELASTELSALQLLDNTIEKKSLEEYRKSVEGAGVSKTAKKPDVKQYLSGMPGDIGGAALKTTNLVKEHVLGFNEKTVNSILKVMNPANSTLGAINSVIGFVFGAMALVEGAKNMSWMEFADNGLGLANSAVTAASKGAGFVKLFTGKDNALTAKSMTSALIVADLGLQAAHLATLTRDEYHRMKAAEKFKNVLKDKKKAGESAEFEKNMLLLQDKISSSRTKSTFTKLGLSGAMVVTLFVCPPVGAVIAALQFGGGIVNRVLENRRKRANKYYLFDNHFKIEEQVDELIQTKKVKEPVNKEKLMDQVRRRVAASIGFASPSHAADAFAKRYAQKMIELANAGGDNSEFYVQLIKGFGLFYRYIAPGHKKNRPSAADLAKKLTS